MSQEHFDDLHAALQRMQLVIDESNATVKQYQQDMETMRKVSENVCHRECFSQRVFLYVDHASYGDG